MITFNFLFPVLGTQTLVSVWKKGKKGDDYRFLFKDISGNETLIWFEPSSNPVMGGKCNFVNISKENYKSSNQIKNRYYNYYLCDIPYEAVSNLFEDAVKGWYASEPLVSLPNTYYHQKLPKNFEPIQKVNN